MTLRKRQGLSWWVASQFVLSITVLSIVALSISASPVRAESVPLVNLDLYFAEPRIQQVSLSPRGDRIAYLLREPFGSSLWWLDPETGRSEHRLDTKKVSDLAWSPDGQDLYLVSGPLIGFLPADAQRARWIARLDPERRQRFLGVARDRPGQILISESPSDSEHRLLRIDTDGRSEVLLESDRIFRNPWLGKDGEVALVQGVDGMEIVIERMIEGRREAIHRCDFANACTLVAATESTESTESTDRLLLRQRWQGNLWALVWHDLVTGRDELIHIDPFGLADLAEVGLDAGSVQPLWVRYSTDRWRNAALDPRLAEALKVVESEFGEREIRVDGSVEGRYLLIEERGARLQFHRYHLFDRQRGTTREILAKERSTVPALPAERLAERRHFSYPASDGRTAHGFVSIPPGIDPASAPLVARIHGGPWNHVGPGFDRMTQFLVERGYVVFEPNFRSSTGYGLDYLRAGRGEFGDGLVQRDIEDGVAYLTANGIGDRERAAIVGHSFGGFAALGGVAYSAQWFKAGIASAPPIDLVRTLRDFDDDATLMNGLPLKPLLRKLLVDVEDRQAVEALRARSPERRFAETSRPLLIFAGGQDAKVSVVDVKHYASALDDLGRDVSLWIDDDLGHGLEGDRATRAFLLLTERFLAHHLGGRQGTESDERLTAYLNDKLRLAGPGLAEEVRRRP